MVKIKLKGDLLMRNLIFYQKVILLTLVSVLLGFGIQVIGYSQWQ